MRSEAGISQEVRGKPQIQIAYGLWRMPQGSIWHMAYGVWQPLNGVRLFAGSAVRPFNLEGPRDRATKGRSRRSVWEFTDKGVQGFG